MRLRVLPPLSPTAVWQPRVRRLPFPLSADWDLHASAPQALYCGVRALELAPGDEVLVPAYHDGEEVEALLRAGLVPRFYSAGAMLQPDPDMVDELLTAKVKAFLLIHYLGFPQDAPRWRAWCDERDLILIEDAARAWLASIAGESVGSYGDMAVFGLSETLGLRAGAALVTRGIERTPRDPSRATRAARATRRLLPRLADPQIASRRRANYAVLLEELAELVPAPYRPLPDGASPLAMPIEHCGRDALQSRLAAAGIVAPTFWPTAHPALGTSDSAELARRRERTLLLPVHQQLAPDDLVRIATAVGRPRRRTHELRLEVVASIGELREEWTELAEQADNVFLTWEWLSTWWRHFGAGRSLRIVVCRTAGGQVRAILPLYRYARRPLRVVRYLGHGASDQLGPVCAPEDRLRTARAIRRALDLLGADLMLADHHPADESWSALCGGRLLATVGAPVLRREGRSWQQILAGCSRNLRHQVGKRERKLVRERGLAYRQGGEGGEVAQDVESVFALHADRWGSRGSQFTGAHLAFHREFASVAHERGWLRLWLMEADGRTVAAEYGFRFRGVEYAYQSGRDTGWSGPSIGFVLAVHAIRAAVEDGVREYRFLRGDEPFKYRFANADRGIESFAVPCGRRGRLALAAGAALPASVLDRGRRRVTR